jgi:hypothetical protein
VGLGVAALLTSLLIAGNEFGFGHNPWFGWWDSNTTVTAPFRLATHPRPGGASARAGLRDGDILDMRVQTLDARTAMVYQPLGGAGTILSVDRFGVPLNIVVWPSSVWDNATFWKLLPLFSRLVAGLACAIGAIMIALARGRDRDGDITALVLVMIVGTMIDPGFAVLPLHGVALLQLIVARSCSTLAALLLVGKTSVAVRIIILGGFALDLCAVFGLWTLRIDPLPFIISLSPWRSLYEVFVWGVVAFVTAKDLRPLPAALFISAVCFATPAFLHDWAANVAVALVANAAIPVGVLAAISTSFRRLPT